MADMYAQMKSEVIALWKCLKDSPEKQSSIDQKIKTIHLLAVKIADQRISQDAQQLIKHIKQFTMGNLKKEKIDQMFQEFLQLERETREL